MANSRSSRPWVCGESLQGGALAPWCCKVGHFRCGRRERNERVSSAGKVHLRSEMGRGDRKELLLKRCNWEGGVKRGGKSGTSEESEELVKWMRGVHPYYCAHRGSTFVVVISGEVVVSPSFDAFLKVRPLSSSGRFFTSMLVA
ncbi:hypothetical protein L1049_025225 [Liquidambar formosana]|uniref:Uncharacterized protein n=1 Tax=Liquidambar formosana TaxID=63359 RepID=A0AAP0RVF1_LIQFO